MAIQGRADFNTHTKKKDSFSDFLLNMDPHPMSGDLARIRNEQSIKQSVRNIVMTELGERPFQPFLGSTVRKSLFEHNDAITALSIETSIKVALQNSEPRVTLIQVKAMSVPESDSLVVNIVFSIVNNPEVQTLAIPLKRVR